MTKFDKTPPILYHVEFNNEMVNNSKKQVLKIRDVKTYHPMEVCKFNGSQCLEFILDKNIRRFKEVITTTRLNGSESFVKYRNSLSDNALSAWDTTAADSYSDTAAQTPDNFAKALDEFVFRAFNCPNTRDVMWGYFHRGTFIGTEWYHRITRKVRG